MVKRGLSSEPNQSCQQGASNQNNASEQTSVCLFIDFPPRNWILNKYIRLLASITVRSGNSTHSRDGTYGRSLPPHVSSPPDISLVRLPQLISYRTIDNSPPQKKKEKEKNIGSFHPEVYLYKHKHINPLVFVNPAVSFIDCWSLVLRSALTCIIKTKPEGREASLALVWCIFVVP